MWGIYFGMVVIIVGLFFEINIPRARAYWHYPGPGLVRRLYRINGKYAPGETFRCDNGYFTNVASFCDGIQNCDDNSDESYGCDQSLCGPDFTCNNTECVLVSNRCDGVQDCTDSSDEWNCDHELSTNKCYMEEGKFLCEDGLRCLHLKETCDGIENCYDGSDENDNCFKYDVDICDRCPHYCFRTPNGPQCFFDFDNKTFHPIYRQNVRECEVRENLCDQKCLMYDGKMQCSCEEHYRLTTDFLYSLQSIAVCSPLVPYGKIIIYSTTKDIKRWNFTTEELDVIQDNVIATALTGAHNYAYWSVMSNNRSSIFRKLIYNNTESVFNVSLPTRSGPYPNTEELINGDLNINSPITSIAVDWITNNLYFTSSEWLSVCSISGNLCANLKNSIYNIAYVALAPKYGFMFWIENREKIYYKTRIFKSALDGSDEHVLVNAKFGSYNSLVSDELSEKLYWYDEELAKIGTIQFDGKGRKLMRMQNIDDIVSMAKFDNVIFWISESDTRIKHIGSPSMSLELFNAYQVIDHMRIGLGMNDYLKLLEDNLTLTHLYVYNPLLQHTKISNPCSSMPCKGLCLSRPSLTKELDYTCLCENFQLANKSRGRQWCNSLGNHSFKIEEEKSHVSTTPSLHIIASKESTTIGVTTQDSEKASKYLRATNAPNTGNGGIGLFFCLFLFIVLLGAGVYFLFKKWQEHRMNDNLNTMMIQKSMEEE